MPDETRKIATFADFMSLDPEVKAELIDGQIVYKMQPSGWHSRVSTCISSRVCSNFDRKPKGDGTGGWWILSEVTVQYRKLERILQPDIAGWRRDRIPVCPKEYPVQERPDWVCEVCQPEKKTQPLSQKPLLPKVFPIIGLSTPRTIIYRFLN